MEFHEFKELVYFSVHKGHVYLSTMGHEPFPDKQIVCSSELRISMKCKRKELETSRFANRKYRTFIRDIEKYVSVRYTEATLEVVFESNESLDESQV